MSRRSDREGIDPESLSLPYTPAGSRAAALFWAANARRALIEDKRVIARGGQPVSPLSAARFLHEGHLRAARTGSFWAA